MTRARKDPVKDQAYYNGVSKAMSCLLRHAGRRRGLYFSEGGFVRLMDLAPCLKPHCRSTDFEQVREDVDFIINTMFNRDNLPRFESTVGPDDEVWIRAMTKHTISNIDTHSVEISEKDAHQAQHRNCQDGSSRPNEKAHSACPSNSAGRSSADQVGRAVSDFRGSDFKDPAQPGWKHLDLLRGEFVLMRRNHHVNGWSYGATLTGEEGLGTDYLRLAQASQLRLSPPELEAVFHETTERFGSPADSGEPALAFELFVELLVETARRQFADLKDAESAAALFEVHLLPLARRLRRAEGASANAQVPAGMQ
ncbi:unnamed protein product [Effrenium voratum]|nr:unnamed protein product [Effrenium voratum]